MSSLIDTLLRLGCSDIEKILGYSKKECAVMLAQHIQLGFTPDITKLDLN